MSTSECELAILKALFNQRACDNRGATIGTLRALLITYTHETIEGALSALVDNGFVCIEFGPRAVGYDITLKGMAPLRV